MPTRIPTEPEELETFIMGVAPQALKALIPQRGAKRAAIVDALATAVDRHRARLSDDALVRIAHVGLQSLSDDHRFVLGCAEELIRRGTEAGQQAFVRVVLQARDNYDPGHRAFEGTVLDQLIDDVLPRFGHGPLTTLLGGLDFDVLAGADGFAELFGAAFSKFEGDLPQDLLGAVRKYTDDCRRSSGSLAEAMALLETAAARSKNPEQLTRAIGEIKADIELEALLDTDDLEVARSLLERVGRDLPFGRAVKIHNTLRPLQTFSSRLPFALVEGVFVRAWQGEREARYPETNLGRTLWPLFVNDPDGARKFCVRFAETCDDRQLFVKVIKWAIRDADRQSSAGKQSAKDTEAILNGLDPAQERAKEELQDRRSALSSQISWAFMQGEPDTAIGHMKDTSNRELMDNDLVAEIIGHAPLLDALQQGDGETAREIADACLDLLTFFRERADAAATAVLLSHRSVAEHITTALVLAALEAKEATPFALGIASWAKALVAEGRVPYATLPFNLACYHAHRSEKAEVLANIETAIAWGKPKTAFLAEKDFAEYRDDPEFVAALEPKPKADR